MQLVREVILIYDLFSRGLVAGILGVIAINIVEFILNFLEISETALWEAGGLVFLSEKALETPLGMLIGILSHMFVGLTLGVVISYYLYFSGTKFAILKGTGVSITALFVALGLVFPLREIATEMQDSPGDVLSAFIDHIVFGALAGYVVLYLDNKKEAHLDENSIQNGIQVDKSYIKKFHISSEMKKNIRANKRNRFIKPAKI